MPDFPNRDYWFSPKVQQDLLRLRALISEVSDRQVREFLLVVYSSIIIAKGPTSVANARDIAHSRSHFFQRDEVPDVWSRFLDRYRRAFRGLKDFSAQATRGARTVVLGYDARALPYRSNVADAIVTSPPYVTAIDYPRGHKFSVWWIGEMIGVSSRVYEQLRYAYIGTESVPSRERLALRSAPIGIPTIDRMIASLDDADEKRAGRARRYFHDMRLALHEMLRTLKQNGHVILVVADSNLRGVEVPTADCLVQLAESLRVDGTHFVHRETFQRTIREASRQLPIKRGGNGEGMKTERVLVLQRVPISQGVPVSALNGHINGAEPASLGQTGPRATALPHPAHVLLDEPKPRWGRIH